ncbi:rcc2 [Scenedesmus sp. PABB004]|nr:rcc2 [Scenedesmus sp. PABB004]
MYNAKDSSIKIMFEPQPQPSVVEGLLGVTVKQIACGHTHTLALDDKGGAWTWGKGDYGKLGHKVQADELAPRSIESFRGRILVQPDAVCGAGGLSTFCVASGPQLYGWGKLKASGDATTHPTPVEDLSGWNLRSLSCGPATFAVAADRSVITWGAATNGELGYGPAGKKSSARPDKCTALEDTATHAVACGTGFTLFLTDPDPKVLERFETWAPSVEVEEAKAAPPDDDAAAGGKAGAKRKGAAAGGAGRGKKANACVQRSCSACADGYTRNSQGGCDCAPGFGSYAKCGDKPTTACKRFRSSTPPDGCPATVPFAETRRAVRQCFCRACPSGTTGRGGPIELASCLPPPQSGAKLAVNVTAAAAFGAALASSSQPRCVFVPVKRGAPRAAYGGYACALGANTTSPPDCVPDAAALAANWPVTSCAPALARLLAPAERHACIEALRYPYQGEAFSCTVPPINFAAWERAGLTAVQCCVGARLAADEGPAARAALRLLAGNKTVQEYPSSEGLSTAAVPAIDLAYVPDPLRVPAYNPSQPPSKLRPTAKPVAAGMAGTPDGAVNETRLAPGRYAGGNITDAQAVAFAEAEITRACTEQYGDRCAAELPDVGRNVTAAEEERAAREAAIAANSSWAPLLDPPLNEAYARPELGGDLLSPPRAGGPAVLKWALADLLEASNGGERGAGGGAAPQRNTSWSPRAGTADTAYELLVAAELLETTADAEGVPQVTFSPESGAVVILTLDDKLRVSGLTRDRLDRFEADVELLRSVLQKSTIDSTVTSFVKRVQKIHKTGKRLALLLGKGEDFTKFVQRITTGLIRRVVRLLVKVFNCSEDSAKKAVKVAQRLLDASLKAQKVVKLLSLQLPVLDAQLMGGRALLCIMDTIRFREDSAELLEFMDRSTDAQAYMTSLAIAEQAVGAQVQIVRVVEEVLNELNVLAPLEEVLDQMAAIVGPVIDSLVDPILAVLRKSLCVNIFGWKKCVSLADVLEGVARLFDWMLGWAEDILNALLEPLWGPVERAIGKMFDLLVPDFNLDWARIPALPELPVVNLDQLIWDIRLRLLAKLSTPTLYLRGVADPVIPARLRQPTVAVGVWRGKIVCYEGPIGQGGEQVFGGKCYAEPHWAWLGFVKLKYLDVWAYVRRRADAGMADRLWAKFEASASSTVRALDCAGSDKERCKAYLASFALALLPEACVDIIDRVIRP